MNTVVETESGAVRGVARGAVLAWRGIPFAAPPVGELRWRAPQPAPSWSGVRDADDFRNAAVQHPKSTPVGLGKYQPVDEDALTLNVVAPAEPSATPRPVMVFIHGGAYLMGSSGTPLYYGNSLVERGDVVFVSINYRLGALGYLDLTEFSTERRPIDGNLGLRDQVAALEWVQRNIAAFGGDPDNVTVFGESAGGNAVTTLLATPAAHGLFHRAIAESSAPGLTTDLQTARSRGRLFLELLGGAAQLGTDAMLVSRAGHHTMRRLEKEQPGVVPYGPVVDGDFLPEDPTLAIAAGRGARVPLIIGTNRDEGTMFTRSGQLAEPSVDVMARTLNAAPDQIAAIGMAYPGFPGKAAWQRLFGDHEFWAPSVPIAEGHSAHAPTFMYRYDYVPTALRAAGLGASHASELLAVFGVFAGKGRVLALGDRRTAARVTTEVQRDWIAFARTGRPFSDWPQYDGAARRTRIIAAQSRVEDDPDATQRRAWAASGLPGTALPVGDRTGPLA
ncbi:carboxylesterase/lipase family protein [Tsukamurella pseudospumae]|uniref:Carboxylic ester hydrolase n=1 Tax=Tsukamurella pseudospumae TaxID=239498 RepID=A0A137ZIH8_9ACTN|nr:carboxylesterase/lipase family protein [Tsukamurella pseudospumae]KXO97995.1 carboxylesterase [Tsukamurella pseudospumae]